MKQYFGFGTSCKLVLDRLLLRKRKSGSRVNHADVDTLNSLFVVAVMSATVTAVAVVNQQLNIRSRETKTITFFKASSARSVGRRGRFFS